MTLNLTFDNARRRWLQQAGAGALAALLPSLGWPDGDSSNADITVTPAVTGLTGKIVIVGGGMAGATAAKYLRLWGGAGLTITLVDPDPSYTSHIMSNLVLNGSRSIDGHQLFSRATLASKYNITLRQAAVSGVDTGAKKVTLDDGGALIYDRLVLAPGVVFDDAYGLTQDDYANRTPHAWRAGAQTTLLRQQIAAMTNGGVFVMTIPKAPYRCPPGPYERACLVADTLKTSGRANCRVIVLDENPDIQAEVATFTNAFKFTHGSVIDYQPGVTQIQIDATTKQVRYVDQLGASQSVAAQVVNPIPPHRATGSGSGGWLAAAGLANSADGRWAKVEVLSFASTATSAQGVHIIGDAAQCGLPKAGHVANQEAKICADAIVRLLGGQQPDPVPVANSACYSPVTASTASWLTAVYQYDSTSASLKIANGGGKAVEAASVSLKNFNQMNTWFATLMKDSFA